MLHNDCAKAKKPNKKSKSSSLHSLISPVAGYNPVFEGVACQTSVFLDRYDDGKVSAVALAAEEACATEAATSLTFLSHAAPFQSSFRRCCASSSSY